MRKITRFLSLLALLMTAATGAWAQETLTVYDGTSEENTSPAYIAFIDEYTRSQTVIPSTALTAMKGCDITAMTFYSATVISFTTECSFDVYLKEVSYSAFAESPTFEPKSSCTTVYQGTLSVVNGTLTLTVTFSKPFHYNGGNLLIGAENTSKGNYYQISFLGRDTGSSLSNICIHDSNNLASAQIKTRKFIPKTTFTYVDPTYTVKLADGTQDAKNWTIASGEKSATGDAADGLTGLSEKDAVTLQYNGRLKVKGVKATSDAAPAGPPSWKLTLSSPAKDLCIIAKGGVIAQQTLDVASTEFTVEMPELTSQTVNIFATDGSGNCWYCTQENMSFAIGQTYQSSPTMTALDGDNSKPLYKLTGTSDVTIPDGKTVVLSGVNISGGSITCDGSVTMILMGANTVTATGSNAAIKIGGPGTTLTITGSGSLTAQGGLEAAGIGTDRIEDGELSFGNIVINGGTVTATGGDEGAGIGTGLAQGQFYNTSITCGDITINGGTVTAIGGLYGAGIGTGPTMSDGGSASITCGDITINGGTVTATGGDSGPGIGTGVFLKYGYETASNGCGAITIGAGVTSVTATKGSGSPNSIGKGYAYGGTQNYGTITIGGTVYATGVTTSPFTYTPSN